MGCQGRGRVESGRVGSGGFQSLTDWAGPPSCDLTELDLRGLTRPVNSPEHIPHIYIAAKKTKTTPPHPTCWVSMWFSPSTVQPCRYVPRSSGIPLDCKKPCPPQALRQSSMPAAVTPVHMLLRQELAAWNCLSVSPAPCPSRVFAPSPFQHQEPERKAQKQAKNVKAQIRQTVI